MNNLVRNYSPHLSPNTHEAPSTAELRKILIMEASEKLEAFLRRWRARRIVEAGSDTAAGGSSNATKLAEPSVVVRPISSIYP